MIFVSAGQAGIKKVLIVGMGGGVVGNISGRLIYRVQPESVKTYRYGHVLYTEHVNCNSVRTSVKLSVFDILDRQ